MELKESIWTDSLEGILFQEITENYRGSVEIAWILQNKEKIDFQPEQYQRCFVWKEKQQRELLRTIFDPNPGVVPELHLRHFTGIKSSRTKPVIIAEVMDGQQRLTTIMRFLENKIKTPEKLSFVDSDGIVHDISNKFRTQLDPEIDEFLLSYKLQICFLTDIADEEAADIFNNKLNSGKPLTRSEKRNAFTTKVASFIRDTARLGEKTRHPLFATKLVNEEIHFDNFDIKVFKYENYDADDLVAVICSLLDRNYMSACNEEDLDKLYRSDEYKIKFIHDKSAIAILNTLQKCITSTVGASNKKIWNVGQVEHLVRIIMYFRTNGIEIEFPEIFTKNYVTKNLEMFKPDADEIVKNKKLSHYRDCVSKQSSKDKIQYAFDKMKNIIVVDETWGLKYKNQDRRKFTDLEKLEALNKQNFKCPMCKEEMKLEDTHGGHIIPFSKGGKTTTDNLVALHASCNILLGNKDLNEWIMENGDKDN